ncbi:MAG: glycosyltransferase family 2 protein [Candidatus Aenigmatarchaeota archaeon]
MLSIIVPTLNEQDVIEEFLLKLKNINLKNYEVIIVDDSTDKTAIIAKKALKKFGIKGKIIKRYGKTGKGSAILDGIKLSKGNFIITIDADLQYPVEYIPLILKKLKKYDFVKTKRIVREDSFLRKLLGLFFRVLVFLLFRIKDDTQSTLRGFRKHVFDEIKIDSKGFAWDVELIYKLNKKGFKSVTIPTIYVKRKIGKSKISLLQIIKMFFELMKIFYNLNFSFKNFLNQ